MDRFVQRDVEGPDGTMHQVMINLSESPISWLHARGKITRRQYDAAEMLRQDWERAQMGARVTMNWDVAAAPSSDARGAPRAPMGGEGQVAARARLHEALDITGAGLRDILWRVACAGEGLSSAERALEWPARAGKLVLGLALDRVADYYRVR